MFAGGSDRGRLCTEEEDREPARRDFLISLKSEAGEALSVPFMVENDAGFGEIWNNLLASGQNRASLNTPT